MPLLEQNIRLSPQENAGQFCRTKTFYKPPQGALGATWTYTICKTLKLPVLLHISPFERLTTLHGI